MYQRAGQGDLDRNDLAGWLMETGDDIDRPDVGGMTMMMWAAAYGQTPTVQMLISHGASVHTAGKEMGAYMPCSEYVCFIFYILRLKFFSSASY